MAIRHWGVAALGFLIAAGCFTDDGSGNDGASTAGGSSTSTSAGGTSTSGASQTSGPPPTSTTTAGSSGSTGGSTGSTLTPCEVLSRAVFVNFDGLTLTLAGADDPIGNTVDVPEDEGDWVPYTGLDRAEILDVVASHYAAFDLCVTDERPDPTVLYDMVVVTEVDAGGPTAFWQTTIDCDDAQGANVTVLKISRPDQLTTELKAAGVSRTLASTYGLELVSEPVTLELMQVSPSAGATFTDDCWGRSPGFACPNPECPGANDQNSFLRLLGVLGPAQG